MSLENTDDNVLLDKDTFAKKYCFYPKAYAPEYWRDAARYAKHICKYLMSNTNISNEEIKELLKDMHPNECFGFYTYFHDQTLQLDNDMWKRILRFNPYGEDIIFNAYAVWFHKNDGLLSAKIMDFPTQSEKFIKFLKEMDPDTQLQHLIRIEVLRKLLNEPEFDIDHEEYGTYKQSGKEED
jgi:hypothetical protein